MATRAKYYPATIAQSRSSGLVASLESHADRVEVVVKMPGSKGRVRSHHSIPVALSPGACALPAQLRWCGLTIGPGDLPGLVATEIGRDYAVRVEVTTLEAGGRPVVAADFEPHPFGDDE